MRMLALFAACLCTPALGQSFTLSSLKAPIAKLTCGQPVTSIAKLWEQINAPSGCVPAPFIAPNGPVTVSVPDVVVGPTDLSARVHVRLAEPARRPLGFQWLLRQAGGAWSPFYWQAQGGDLVFQPGMTEIVVPVKLERPLYAGGAIEVLVGGTTNNPTVTGVSGFIRGQATAAPAPIADLAQPTYAPAAQERGRKRVFATDFLEPVTAAATKGSWQDRFTWGNWQQNNGELAPYADKAVDAGTDPHPIVNGRRVLRAGYLPGQVKSTGRTFDYYAPMLSSLNMVRFTSGLIRLKVVIPPTDGREFAFWLLPADGSWPPEDDIVELDLFPAKGFYSTNHDSRFGTDGLRLPGVKIDDGKEHEIALDVTADWRITLVDGVEVTRRRNIWPIDREWYFIVNQSIGGIGPAPKNPQPGWTSDVTLISAEIWK